MSEDLTTISVTPAEQAILSELTEGLSYFKTELGAFMACAALALALGLEPGAEEKSNATTKWNRGSGAISEWVRLVEWYLPTDQPVKALREYGFAGLKYVAPKLGLGLSIADIFVTTRPSHELL